MSTPLRAMYESLKPNNKSRRKILWQILILWLLIEMCIRDRDLLAALVKERFQWSNILGTQLIKTYDSGKVAENGYYYRNMYFEQTAPNDIQNRLKSNRLDKLGRDYYG